MRRHELGAVRILPAVSMSTMHSVRRHELGAQPATDEHQHHGMHSVRRHELGADGAYYNTANAQDAFRAET